MKGYLALTARDGFVIGFALGAVASLICGVVIGLFQIGVW